jgi:hypothetical protein
VIATYVPWLLLATGALGMVLGVNRTLKRREKESTPLQILAFLSGAALLAAPVGMVFQGGNAPEVSGASIILMLLLGTCLMARALKNLPIALIVAALLGTGLFWLLSHLKEFSFAGDAATQTIVLVTAVLLLVVLVIGFFVEKTLDLFLALLSIGVVVFAVAAAACLQGLLIGLGLTDYHGLLSLLGR